MVSRLIQTNLHHRPQFQSVSEGVEPTIGIEPMNLFLTKEALYRLSYVGILHFRRISAHGFIPGAEQRGAGDEARTRDIQLGRLKLYQLSYSRLFIHNGFPVLMPCIHTNHCRPIEMKIMRAVILMEAM
jgi:hypothetical protein